MVRYLNRIATRMWLLAGLMTAITLVVGLGLFYLGIYFELVRTKAKMPPRYRAELERLVATGQRGSDRYFELYDRYTDDTLRVDDLLLLSVCGALSTLAGGSVAFYFARRISRPITEVARAAAQVAAGDRSVRVTEDGQGGEIAELVHSFNRMAADLHAFERERQVLTAGIAHELRTPLTILRGRLHGLIDGVIEPSEGEADRLLRQVNALGRLVEDLRTLAHADAGELLVDLRPIDLANVVETVAADLRGQADAASVRLVPQLAPAPVRADPLRIAQIVTNLTTNAIKHSPAGGTIVLASRRAGSRSLAEVFDEGDGFRDEDRERLFLPFWRAGADKAKGRPGSGLGLALAAKLAELHGGRVLAENRRDRTGAFFSLDLPAREAAR